MSERKEKAKKMLSDEQFEEAKHYPRKYAATVLSVISAILVIAAIVGGALLSPERWLRLPQECFSAHGGERFFVLLRKRREA